MQLHHSGNEQHGQVEATNSIARLTDEAKEEKINQFEKNYPKNIFIPIIEFLASLGLKDQYEGSVGTREQF